METPEVPTSAAPWIKRAAVALGVLGVAALLATGGSTPADPVLAGSRVDGFDEATVRIVQVAPGLQGATPSERCALLAATAQQQATGMMGRRDLAGYDAMAFTFMADSRTLFYNRRVPIALSVAWFDAEGRWVGSGDLAPCGDVDGCPTIAAPKPFRTALEVPKGGLPALGLGPGSQISITPGCS